MGNDIPRKPENRVFRRARRSVMRFRPRDRDGNTLPPIQNGLQELRPQT
jgi:hypothetical protein